MLKLLLALAIGVAVGYSGIVKGQVIKLVDISTSAVLFLILAVMGAKLADPAITGKLATIGLKGLAFAVLTIVGSLLVVCVPLLVVSYMKRRRLARLSVIASDAPSISISTLEAEEAMTE